MAVVVGVRRAGFVEVLDGCIGAGCKDADAIADALGVDRTGEVSQAKEGGVLLAKEGESNVTRRRTVGHSGLNNKIPIVLLMFLAPFVLHKERDPAFITFIIGSPLLVFLLAYVNYCFAGVCPRYLLDVAPWAALSSGVIGLKALEKDNGKHPVVPILLSLVLLANIVLSGQYHFVEFDGLRVGDFNGLYSIFKSIFNRYNI